MGMWVLRHLERNGNVVVHELENICHDIPAELLSEDSWYGVLLGEQQNGRDLGITKDR